MCQKSQFLSRSKSMETKYGKRNELEFKNIIKRLKEELTSTRS